MTLTPEQIDAIEERYRTEPLRLADLEEFPTLLAMARRCLIASEILDDMRDDNPCSLDHHGYCQEHVYLTADPACPHKRAAAFLAENP